MKRLTALFLVCLIILSFIGCSGQDETDVHTPADLSWWEENIAHADNCIDIGNSGICGIVDSADALQLLEKVDYSIRTDIVPLGGYENAAHSISLNDRNSEKWIIYKFYEDFTYVSFAGSDGPENTNTLYWLENSDEIKQFFIDNGYYMPLHIRTEIIDSITRLFTSDNLDFINSAARPTDTSGDVTNIPDGGEIEYLNICNVTPYIFGTDNQKYTAYIEIILRYGDLQKCYVVQLTLDEIYNLIKAYVDEDNMLANWAKGYMIADVDYSMWMSKLDTPQHNKFNYWLYAGSSGHFDSSMEWTGAIMNCINNLSLGEQVSIDTKAYPSRQVYKIVLNEDNENYREKPVILRFYDDCKYVVICNCHEENSQPSVVCGNHTTAYKVNNPQSVIDIFSMDGQYVSPRDYESLEKFAQKFMENTAGSKLNETAKGNRKIVEDYKFEGNIANFTAENTDHLFMENGKEEFVLDYVAMFVKPESDTHDSYIGYSFRISVYRKGDSWEIQSLHIY